MRVPIVVLCALASQGCAVLALTSKGLEISAEKAVTQPRNKSAWSQQAQTALLSGATGRPVLQADVQLLARGKDRVKVRLAISSTTIERTDPRVYYAWMKLDGQHNRVGETEVGDWTDAPITYSFPCKKKRKTTLTFDDGSRTEISEEYDSICSGVEHYYTRVSTLDFPMQAMSSGDSMSLELRDLGTNVEFLWTL